MKYLVVNWLNELRRVESSGYYSQTAARPQPSMSDSSTTIYEPQLHVVLHQPEIAYNTGSVGRTCVAAHAKLWLVRPLGFRVDDYYLRRAGLDYWERLAWEAVDDWNALVSALPTQRRWLFTKRAERSYWQADYRPGDTLVFGSESAGLPDSLQRQHRDSLLRIPTSVDVRSLNLSNSVAVAVYEALRQWQVGQSG
jgi:tRNA (cytidine/uridine-2'-O-)-methyltransferase